MQAAQILFVVATVFTAVRARSTWCGTSDVIPNYAALTHPKKVLSIPQAHGICVAHNGHFAIISWNTDRKFRIFDSHAGLMKTAILPPGSRPDDCAFAPTAIYISDPASKRLLKYSTRGDFIKAISTFVYFYNRFTWCNDYLYATIPPLKKIAIFYNDKEIQKIDIKTKDIVSARGGLSFDTHGNLYAALPPNKAQVFNIHGKPKDVLIFNEVGTIDGLVIDYGKSDAYEYVATPSARHNRNVYDTVTRESVSSYSDVDDQKGLVPDEYVIMK